jgi:hypothetical protein
MQRTGNFFASPLLRLQAVFLVLTITVFWGCSLGEITNRPTAGTFGRSPGNAEITRTSHQVFELKTIIPPGRQPRVEVRLARPGEISKLWPASFFEGMSAGSAIAAAGVGVSLLCPMAQGAAVGGAIVLPAFTALGIMNHRQRSALVRSMDETDFPNKLENLLQSEFARRFPGQVTTSPEVQVLILGYGLFSSGYSLSSAPDQDEFCFYCDAQIQVKKNGRTLFEDSITWRARERSDDLPPPRLARLSEFAAHDGRLARDTFIEAGEVMAAIIAKRLGGRS